MIKISLLLKVIREAYFFVYRRRFALHKSKYGKMITILKLKYFLLNEVFERNVDDDTIIKR